MNLEGIKVGDVFKNYPLLCAALGEKATTGNAKKAQIAEWERFFKYTKKGNNFVIDEIYNNPVAKKSHGNLSPHINVSKLCLIKLLEENKHHLVMSKSKLALALKYVNEDFYKYYGDRKKLSNIAEVQEIQVIDFMNTTSNAYKNSIDKIISDMEKEGIINVETRRYVEEHVVEVFDDGSKEESFIHREATEYEIKTFLNIQAKLLNDYNVSNVQQINQMGKRHEFNYQLECRLNEELNINRTYNCLDIHSTDITVDRGYTLELGENYKDRDVFKDFLKLWVSDRLAKIQQGIDRAHSEYNNKELRPLMSATMDARRDFANKDNMEKLVKMLIVNTI